MTDALDDVSTVSVFDVGGANPFSGHLIAAIDTGDRPIEGGEFRVEPGGTERKEAVGRFLILGSEDCP